MSLVKCSNGHFYDAQKYGECPYCYIEVTFPAEEGEHTQEYDAMAEDDLTRGYESAKSEEEHTIGITFSEDGSPAVGWLVCVSGPEKGRDYRLHAGRNYVGCSWDSDVAVNDREISKSKHFSIVYDSKNNEFLIVPGEGTLTYLGDEILKGVQILTERQHIRAGKSEFAFRAFCREGDTWDAYFET